MSQFFVRETGSSAADVETLTGNSGGAVGADAAFNINTLGTGSITVAGNAGTNTLTAQLTGLNNHAVLVGAGTATITNLAVGATNTVLLGNTGLDPSFGTVPNAALQNSSITVTAGSNITVTGSPVSLGGAVTIAASQVQLMTSYTAIAFVDSPYSATSTDNFISVNSSGGAVTVRLPNAPASLRIFTVKDRTGNAPTNQIVITTVGGVVLIDGATTYPLDQDFDSVQLLFNGTSYEVF